MNDTTHEDLVSVRSAMDNYLAWFQQTLEQPYTVAEMVENLHHFLELHFWYYSNNPAQVPEKMQRIFAIENRLRQDFFSRTRVFSAGLAVAENKSDKLKSEIALYEYPFLFYMQGRYYNNGFEMVIPNAMMMLAGNNSPYFEFVFDENLEIKKENGIQDFWGFLSDVYYLQFLRESLSNLEQTKDDGEMAFAGNMVEPKFDSFEDTFKVKDDFKAITVYLENYLILDKEGVFIEKYGNKKYLTILISVLRSKFRLKPVADAEIAVLIRKQFKMNSFSPDSLSKNLGNHDELFAEMMRELQF
ncbi:MAG TPA: hypothetical protein PK914_07135 [Smithellaceae bacterium]|nr:hypothetical protein [Smithellaceae bacterium]